MKTDTSYSASLVAGLESVVLTDKTSQMYSVHNAICRIWSDDQQVSDACDADYEIVEAAVAANKDWISMIGRIYSSCAPIDSLDSSVSGIAAQNIDTSVILSQNEGVIFLTEQEPLNSTECN